MVFAEHISDIEVTPDFTCVIQAGGQSKRMGTSKALIDFLGEPLILQSIRRLYPICEEMIITTNEPEKMNFLNEYIDEGKMRLVSDPTDERGALIGIHTALSSVKTKYASLTACDMIFPSPKLMRELLRVLKGTDADIAMPVSSKGLEPFHAVYKIEKCLPVVEKYRDNGDLRAIYWTQDVNCIKVDASAYDEDEPGSPFTNVNTQIELRELENKLKEKLGEN